MSEGNGKLPGYEDEETVYELDEDDIHAIKIRFVSIGVAIGTSLVALLFILIVSFA